MQSNASNPAARAQGLALPRRSAVAAMPSLTSTPRQGDAIASAIGARPICDRCWAEWFATRGCFRLNRQTYYPDASGADSPVRPVSPVINARVQTGKIHLDPYLGGVSDTRYHRSSRHSYEDFMLSLALSPGQTIQTSLSVVGSNAARTLTDDQQSRSSMSIHLSAYLATLVVNIICDLAWLGTMATRVYRPTLRIDREGPLLAATFNDRLALDTAQLLRSFFALPLVAFRLIATSHWEALRLWLKGARLVARPHTTFNPGLAIGKSRVYNLPESSTRATGPAGRPRRTARAERQSMDLLCRSRFQSHRILWMRYCPTSPAWSGSPLASAPSSGAARSM